MATWRVKSFEVFVLFTRRIVLDYWPHPQATLHVTIPHSRPTSGCEAWFSVTVRRPPSSQTYLSTGAIALDNSVYAMAFQSAGKTVMVGAFTTYGGASGLPLGRHIRINQRTSSNSGLHRGGQRRCICSGSRPVAGVNKTNNTGTHHNHGASCRCAHPSAAGRRQGNHRRVLPWFKPLSAASIVIRPW